MSKKSKEIPTFVDFSEGRKNNFDFFRWLLATFVLLSHAFGLLFVMRRNGTFYTEHPDPLGQITGNQTDFGFLAVNYFFVISGFLITASWKRGKGLLDFIKKRFLRVYPGLTVALLFCILVVGPLGGAHLPQYFVQSETYRFLRTLLMLSHRDSLPGVFENLPLPNAVNGSLWTIRYEIYCYVMVAVFGLLSLLSHRRAVLGIFFLFLIGYAVQPPLMPGMAEDTGHPAIRLFTEFMAGMVFYLYRDRIPYSLGLFALSVILCIVAVPLNLLRPIFPIFGTYIILFAVFHPAIRLNNFAQKGDFSYGMYIYGFPVQQLLIAYMGRSLNPYLLFLLSFLITLVLAILSWHIVEKTALNLKDNVQSKQKQ